MCVAMGNEKSNSYWEAELPPNYDRVGIENFIRAKYMLFSLSFPVGFLFCIMGYKDLYICSFPLCKFYFTDPKQKISGMKRKDGYQGIPQQSPILCLEKKIETEKYLILGQDLVTEWYIDQAMPLTSSQQRK